MPTDSAIRKPPAPRPDEAKKERLARALRENLRRRKVAESREADEQA